MITKIQKLSAIHNSVVDVLNETEVVYDVKDTKIVSNSQLVGQNSIHDACCL